MSFRAKSARIALTVVLAAARLGSGAQDRSLENQTAPSLATQRAELAEAILAAKERALGEPLDAAIRASLKGRMEALSIERLQALLEQGDGADLPSVLGSVTSDLVYTPVTPCRVFDSRPSQGGPGPIAANSQWNVLVAGTVGFPAQGGFAGGCGVPVGATSAIINFVTVLPGGPGNIRAWAVADPQPPAPLAAILNYGSVVGLPAIANGVAVPLCNPAATSCAAGDLRLQADTSGTNILGDVVGYFGPAVGGFVDLTTAQTVGGSKTFSSDVAVTATLSAALMKQNGNTVCDESGNCGPPGGIWPIANGGTGSATQNFVDLSTAQIVGGDKTLTGNVILVPSTPTTGNIMKGGLPFLHNFGSANTFIGVSAGNFTMSGINNTASGAGALSLNTTGYTNTATGASALLSNTDGFSNTATGMQALRANTTGSENTASGAGALFNNTIGVGNTANGFRALRFNSTGVGNTANGRDALAITTGAGNTASGDGALSTNTTGSNNTGLGSGANVSSGALNNAAAIGANAVVSQSDSLVLGNAVNVGIGTSAPNYKLHVVGENVRVQGDNGGVFPRFSLNFTGGGVDQKKWQMYAGPGALSFTALNDGETAETGWLRVDRGAGTAITGIAFPNGNVAIGMPSTPDRLGVNGTISLGVLGSAGATALCLNAVNQISTCSSSERYKSNIDSFNAGLSLIEQLHPVSFNWRDGGMADLGLVAEEVRAVEPLLTTTNDRGEVEGVKYDRVAVVLVNAIKEQQVQLEEQTKRNEAQRAEIETMQAQIERLMKIVCAQTERAHGCAESPQSR